MRNPLDHDAYWHLKESAQEPGAYLVKFATTCDAEPGDKLEVSRIGKVGCRHAGRIQIAFQEDDENPVTILLGAAEARQLAASILNGADELDGARPLVFMPRTPVARRLEDDPSADTDEADER